MGKPFDAKGFMNLTSPTEQKDGWRLHSAESEKNGVLEAFTPSLNNFDKPKSFMDDVKESVVSEMIEDNKQQLGSPSWAWKAQENLNHTGEQPLIVQQYLSSNKIIGIRTEGAERCLNAILGAQIKENKKMVCYQLSNLIRPDSCPTVLEVTKAKGYTNSPLLPTSFLPLLKCPMNRRRLLTTDMEGLLEPDIDDFHDRTHQSSMSQSDSRCGRPQEFQSLPSLTANCSSLLRARRRIPSAPGVKATLEFKTDLHLQQSLAAKREDKYKTVEIPEELLPITDSGETVHQFLVGARYNRGHYRDAKCLSNLGLYVCRDDITNCFLRTSAGHHHVSPRPPTSDFLSNGKLSQSSSSIRSAQSCPKPWSLRPKSARVGSKSKQAWDPVNVASAPRSSPTDSRNSFDSSSGTPRTTGTNKVKIIDGRSLEAKDPTSSSGSFQDDSCMLCQTGVTLCKGSIPAWSRTERRNSNPARLWSGRKRTNMKKSVEDGVKDGTKGGETVAKAEGSAEAGPGVSNIPGQVQQMVLQQYHLRIMGTKVGVEEGIPSAPRSNFLYQNVRTTKMSPRAASSKSRENANSSNNNSQKNRISMQDTPSEPERPASQISVRITSTKSLSDGDHDGDSHQERDVTVASQGRAVAGDDLEDNDQRTKSADETELPQGREEVAEAVGTTENHQQIVNGDVAVASQVPDKGDPSLITSGDEGVTDVEKEVRIDEPCSESKNENSETVGKEVSHEGKEVASDCLDEPMTEGSVNDSDAVADCHSGDHDRQTNKGAGSSNAPQTISRDGCS